MDARPNWPIASTANWSPKSGICPLPTHSASSPAAPAPAAPSHARRALVAAEQHVGEEHRDRGGENDDLGSYEEVGAHATRPS